MLSASTLTSAIHWSSLVLLDDVQRLRVMSSLIAHDVSLIDYLQAGRRNASVELAALADILSASKAHLDTLANDVTRDVESVRSSEATWAFQTFLTIRRRLWVQFERRSTVAGAARHQLRAFVSAIEPEVAARWPSAESSDRHKFRQLHVATVAMAERMASWVGALASKRFGPTVVVCFEHRHAPQLTTSWEISPNPDDDAAKTIRISLALPVWLAAMPRYVPLIAHELAHPFVEWLRSESPEFSDSLSNARDAVKTLFLGSVSDWSGDREDLARRFAWSSVTEICADFFAIALCGRSYRYAFAALRHARVLPEPCSEQDVVDEEPQSTQVSAFSFQVGAGVRVALMAHTERQLAANSNPPPTWLDGALEDHRAWREHDASPSARRFRSQLEQRGKLLITSLCSGIAPEKLRPQPGEIMPLIHRIHSTETHSGAYLGDALHKLDHVWVQLAAIDAPSAPAKNTLQALQRLPEGRAWTRGWLGPRDADLLCDGPPWTLWDLQLRPLYGADAAPQARSAGVLAHLVANSDGPGATQRLVAAPLGQPNLKVFAPGYLSRAPRQAPTAPPPWVAFSQRQVLRPIRGRGLAEADWHRATSMSQLHLEPVGCGVSLGDAVKAFLDVCDNTMDVEVIAAFHMQNWANLLVVWHAAHRDGIQSLVDHELVPKVTRRPYLVERSITHEFAAVARCSSAASSGTDALQKPSASGKKRPAGQLLCLMRKRPGVSSEALALGVQSAERLWRSNGPGDLVALGDGQALTDAVWSLAAKGDLATAVSMPVAERELTDGEQT